MNEKSKNIHLIILILLCSLTFLLSKNISIVECSYKIILIRMFFAVIFSSVFYIFNLSRNKKKEKILSNSNYNINFFKTNIIKKIIPIVLFSGTMALYISYDYFSLCLLPCYLSSFIYNLIPLFTIIIRFFLIEKKIEKKNFLRNFLSIILSILGVFIAFFYPFDFFIINNILITGLLYGLFSTLLTSLSWVIQEKIINENVRDFHLIIFIENIITYLILSIFIKFKNPEYNIWYLIVNQYEEGRLMMIIISSFVSHFIFNSYYSYCLKFKTSDEVSLFLNSTPFFVFILESIVFIHADWYLMIKVVIGSILCFTGIFFFKRKE